MRIMLVIASVSRGGAERVLSIMANHWAAVGHQVILVTLAERQSNEYQLHPQVKRMMLDAAVKSRNLIHGLLNNLRRINRLRQVIKHTRPDIAVSFVTHTNLLSLLATLGTGIPVIVSERADPSQIEISRSRRILRRLLYPHAAAIVVQTEIVERMLRREMPAVQVRVIPNPIPQADPDEGLHCAPLRSIAQIPKTNMIISAMGRLDSGKGFDLLIEAFARIHRRYPDWHLVIFGEGVERSKLEQLAVQLAVQEYVHLPGSVRSARQYLAQTDLFVLSSRFEGFPNVLLEAMACGLPVVSFDCPSGPSEIIQNGVDGLLVPCKDTAALENAVAKLIMNPVIRERLGSNAREITKRFSVSRIMELWNQLAETVIARGVHN